MAELTLPLADCCDEEACCAPRDKADCCDGDDCGCEPPAAELVAAPAKT
jgi:hypothetical protein